MLILMPPSAITNPLLAYSFPNTAERLHPQGEDAQGAQVRFDAFVGVPRRQRGRSRQEGGGGTPCRDPRGRRRPPLNNEQQQMSLP